MLETIYLVRHAAPDLTTNIPYTLPPGPPLSEIGLREASQTANWLIGHQIEQIFSSPFDRTHTTAKAISNALGKPITLTEALREGAPYETHSRVRERIAELLQQLDDSPFRTIALVTHGICIQMVLQVTTNNTIDLSNHVYDRDGNHSPTAGVWRGQRESGRWQWEFVFRPS
jgi:2,3-bisphosphoglycerate-dependent phosphoglycerate mutase